MSIHKIEPLRWVQEGNAHEAIDGRWVRYRVVMRAGRWVALMNGVKIGTDVFKTAAGAMEYVEFGGSPPRRERIDE